MVAIKGLIAAAAASYMGSGYNSGYGSGSLGSYDWTMAGTPLTGTAFCAIDKFTPSFPSGQSQVVAPTNQAPRYVGLAFGVQNYTCTSAGNYSSTGAVAELIDVSCLAFDPSFGTIQHDLYNVWDHLMQQPIQAFIDLFHFLNPPAILAQHFFQPNPTTGQGVSPVWDFRSNPAFKGKNDAFILAKGKGSIPAPDDPTKNVAWLQVENVQGGIADQVFRFDTVGGQPPSSCKYGESNDLSIKYVSKYIFYGGSDKLN